MREILVIRILPEVSLQASKHGRVTSRPREESLAEHTDYLMILVEYEGLQRVPARGLQVLNEVIVIVPEVVVEVTVRSLVNEEVATVTGLGETEVLSVDLHQPRAVRAGLR